MKNNVYQNAASNLSNFVRSPDDFYITHHSTIEALLHREVFNKDIWEPACGNGVISECLKEFNYNVFSTDLRDYNYKDMAYKLDFLTIDEKSDLYNKYDIITNPPYNINEEFVLQAIKMCKNKCAMLLKIQFLETTKRFNGIFKNYPPKYVYVFSSRQACSKYPDFLQHDENGNIVKNKKGEALKIGSASLYCWFIWEKGFKGEPIIRWI